MGASPYTQVPPVSPDATDSAPCDQLALWGATTEDAFNRYHAEHPEVYRVLLSMARRGQELGYKRWSVDAIFHILRWETAIQTGNPDGFKLNDHFRPTTAACSTASRGWKGCSAIAS